MCLWVMHYKHRLNILHPLTSPYYDTVDQWINTCTNHCNYWTNSMCLIPTMMLMLPCLYIHREGLATYITKTVHTVWKLCSGDVVIKKSSTYYAHTGCRAHKLMSMLHSTDEKHGSGPAHQTMPTTKLDTRPRIASGIVPSTCAPKVNSGPHLVTDIPIF